MGTVKKYTPDCTGVSTGHNTPGHQLPEGMNEFINQKLAEPDCLGLVPLTKGAQKAIEEHGLRPAYHGIRLEPEGITFCAYR